MAQTATSASALAVLNFSYVQPRVVRMRTVTMPLRSLTTADPAKPSAKAFRALSLQCFHVEMPAATGFLPHFGHAESLTAATGAATAFFGSEQNQRPVRFVAHH